MSGTNGEMGVRDGDIAVIGMSGRFPGAANVDEFWQNLVKGVDAVSRFREDELEFVVAKEPDQKSVRARGVLENVGQFDAAFFDINPREAEVMDPQHRLFLECAWESLESAGYDPGQFPGLIGVFAGCTMNTYLLYNLCSHRAVAARLCGNYQVGDYSIILGNDKDFLPTRISYKLNLNGPSMAIQTACSTSLVTICQACTNLLTYQCDMALAGGVSISFPQKRDYLPQDGSLMSSEGICRAFDAGADGTVFGHGAAVVLLKRLADAVADGDTVLAVIKGTAVNNDGAMKVSYAAPSVNAQANVIAAALAAANVDAESISYLEAHGTGTALGDPIEVAALTKAFRENGAKRDGYCAIGTAKTNVGHLDVAAGATGLIKTVLQLQHGLIPPLLHFKYPNPKIDFANSPFFPVRKMLEWKRGEQLRRAGVSSFGVGGTNAHVIMEEAPEFPAGSTSRAQQLLVLSAKTESALQIMTQNLAIHLANHPQENLSDVAFTLKMGRKPFKCRRTLVVNDMADAVNKLRSNPEQAVCSGMGGEPGIVFLFPGQGAQFLDMGRGLYDGESVFRQEIDRCAEILRGHLNFDLRSILYPKTNRHQAEVKINETAIAQPAIFSVEYALAKLWISWGIKPAVLIGHSIGEYVAAVLAETFTLENALPLLAARARLMQSLPGGSMLAVRLDDETVSAWLPPEATLAALNGVQLCTVSGPTHVLKSFQQKLESENIASKMLATSHAFHSAMMEPILPEFTELARRTPWAPPKIPWISTCTGTWMKSEDLADPAYWSRQLRQTVRFGEALDRIIDGASGVLLEVGPGHALSQIIHQHPAKSPQVTVCATLDPASAPGNDLALLLSTLGKLWLAGVRPDWKKFYAAERRRRIPLPTYPFERKRHWVEPEPTGPSFPPSNACASKNSPEQMERIIQEQLRQMRNQLDMLQANEAPAHSEEKFS